MYRCHTALVYFSAKGAVYDLKLAPSSSSRIRSLAVSLHIWKPDFDKPGTRSLDPLVYNICQTKVLYSIKPSFESTLGNLYPSSTKS